MALSIVVHLCLASHTVDDDGDTVIDVVTACDEEPGPHDIFMTPWHCYGAPPPPSDLEKSPAFAAISRDGLTDLEMRRPFALSHVTCPGCQARILQPIGYHRRFVNGTQRVG